MPDILLDVVDRYWGYPELLPFQRQAMDAILSGMDSVVVLPTGGGKSLCFQVPALIRRGLGIVVSPLISLMRDQVEALKTNGINALSYNSSMSSEEKRDVINTLQSGRCRLLYVSPERLAGDSSSHFFQVLKNCSPSFIAVDEAHCISHWGHEFRPEYRQLGALRNVFPGISMHAFTATATEQVRLDIAEQLKLSDPLHIVGGFDRPNLVYRVLRRNNLKAQIKRVLTRHEGEAGIIYCITRKEVDKLAAHLKEDGLKAVPYHAGLSPDIRRSNQDDFSNERVDIVVATVAFGMGIDRSNVRFVIHAGAPRSIEHYQQEAGRSGRDGLEAECMLIWSGADFASWQRILEFNSEFSENARRHIAEMARYVSRVSCRHRALVEHFGQSLGSTNCNACDVCLGELEAIDEPIIVAQKIISCVARVDQRWGTTHVIGVLRVSTSDRIRAAGHDRLSTFKLLEGTPIPELRAFVEQLVEQDCLSQTTGEYPVLRLTEKSWSVLRNETGIELFRQIRPPKKKRSTKRDSKSWEGVDAGLFEALRLLRLEIAGERGIPPFIILHDTSLRDLARVRPSTIKTLLSVHGLGEKKAADFGERFIEKIDAYCADNKIDTDIKIA